jgi:predicted permease
MIGKSVTLNGVAHTVVGIMPPNFEYEGAQDVLLPMRLDPANQNEGHNWMVVGRLRQGVAAGQARSEMKLLFEKFRAIYPRQAQDTETFGVRNWRQNMTGESRELLWILLGAVSLVLMIACANVANLQLTRAVARRKEMAIRLALGAGAGRLIRQLLTEGLILALLGGLAGFLLANWALAAMLALVPEGMIPRVDEIGLDWRVLAFALVASLLTGVIFGLAPAVQALRVDVNHTLKDGAEKGGASRARGRLRGALVVVEVALALALTVGAGLLLRTFANLRGVEPGFQAGKLLTFELTLPGKKYDSAAKINDLYLRALGRFRGLPGVETAALTNKLPLDRWFNLPYRLAGESEISGSTEYRLVSPDYFRAMKMSVRKGRPFDDRDVTGAEPVVIINDAFARRRFANSEAIGQPLFLCCEHGGLAPRRVIGVVNETKQRSLSQPAPTAIFIPMSQAGEDLAENSRQASFVLRTSGDPLSLIAAVRDATREIDPSLPIRNLRSMEQLVGRSVAPQRFNLSLLGLFAGLGLALAAVGIYGVMAYGVSQRTHEIGLRMALGARARDVRNLVIKQGIALALIGVAIGLAASLALTRLMKNLLFGVSATDPMTFAAIASLTIVIALLACWIPARRATKVDPMIALRRE